MKWIGVMNRLPMLNEKFQSKDVLVFTASKEIQVGFRYGTRWMNFENSETIVVTHWMPLPEPPKTD